MHPCDIFKLDKSSSVRLDESGPCCSFFAAAALFTCLFLLQRPIENKIAEECAHAMLHLIPFFAPFSPSERDFSRIIETFFLCVCARVVLSGSLSRNLHFSDS
jgi:hypothetical protein